MSCWWEPEGRKGEEERKGGEKEGEGLSRRGGCWERGQGFTGSYNKGLARLLEIHPAASSLVPCISRCFWLEVPVKFRECLALLDSGPV